MNVRAANLIWRYQAAVVAEGLTYSNVTTDTLRLNSDGDFIGVGDETEIVHVFPDSREAPADELTSDSSKIVEGDRTTLLTLDDPWFVSVKKVCLCVCIASVPQCISGGFALHRCISMTNLKVLCMWIHQFMVLVAHLHDLFRWGGLQVGMLFLLAISVTRCNKFSNVDVTCAYAW